jgi:hypothetical protein
MGAPQRQVIEAIGEKVSHVDERFDGYRTELLKVIEDILRLEQERPNNVAQQIQTRITALGELLARRQGADL